MFETVLKRAGASLVDLNPEVPMKVEEIINKALEQDRDLRYRNRIWSTLVINFSVGFRRCIPEFHLRRPGGVRLNCCLSMAFLWP
jgi:hypothetical protein